MSAGRIWAIVIVALLHALIGYAFVTGLATSVIQRVKEDLKTFDVEEPPPPEEEPPPPPPDAPPSSPPPVTAPPMQRQMQSPNPIQAQQPLERVVVSEQAATKQEPIRQEPVIQTKVCPNGQTVPITATCPEPQRPRQQPKAPVQRSGTITNDDYPSAAIRAEASGTTTMRLSIGADGRVTDCSVTRSSGNSSLDTTACSLARRRFRYTPATDENGNAVAGSATRSVRWELPEE